MITLETGDGERVDFYVLEETRISGMNYLLVTDAPEDAQEGECYILKDKSRQRRKRLSTNLWRMTANWNTFIRFLRN